MIDDDNEDNERELNLIISSIIRIMSHILSKMPFKDMPTDTVLAILDITFKQSVQSI